MLTISRRKKERSGCLAKPESWPERFWRMSITFSTPDRDSKPKNSSAVLPAKPIVQRRCSIECSELLHLSGRTVEGIFLGLAAEGVFKRGIALRDKKRIAGKRGKIIEGQEPVFRLALRFKNASAPDVHGGDTALQERGTNHQKAVALQGIFFGAHQSDVLPPRILDGPIHPDREVRGLSAERVVNQTVALVDAWIAGPSSKRFAQK